MRSTTGPQWYRTVWALSNGIRVVMSRLPHGLRKIVSEIIAATVYWPLARFAALLSRFGVSAASLPLSWYADKSFYVMRTDAYDRFCTQLEKRFTSVDIEQMLLSAGFEKIRFSESPPYWCAVGIRSRHGLPTDGAENPLSGIGRLVFHFASPADGTRGTTSWL